MTRVSLEDLKTAALWLENNEGEDAERLPCERVAAWIMEEVARREQAATIRDLAKKSGGSPAQVRLYLKRKGEI